MNRLDIERAGNALLSLGSTDDEHTYALTVLEGLLASLALLQPPEQQPLLDAFLSLQDDLEYNCEVQLIHDSPMIEAHACSAAVTAILLDWLGRSLARHSQAELGSSSEGTTESSRSSDVDLTIH